MTQFLIAEKKKKKKIARKLVNTKCPFRRNYLTITL